MNLSSTISVYGGGPGSGCVGPNCGRPREQELLDKALAHIPAEHAEGIKVSVADLRRSYGLSKGGKVYIDKTALLTEHPLFIAGVLYHEMVHSRQDHKKMDWRRREDEARRKTVQWALYKKVADDDHEGKAALQKVIKESDNR